MWLGSKTDSFGSRCGPTWKLEVNIPVSDRPGSSEFEENSVKGEDLKSKMKSMRKRARSDLGIDKQPLKGVARYNNRAGRTGACRRDNCS